MTVLFGWKENVGSSSSRCSLFRRADVFQLFLFEAWV